MRPGSWARTRRLSLKPSGSDAQAKCFAKAETPDFVADAATYRRLLVAEGFEVLKERNRRDFAIDVFRQIRTRTGGAAGGPAPLGLHVVMGASAAQKVKNMIGDISSGLIAPTELICRVAG